MVRIRRYSFDTDLDPVFLAEYRSEFDGDQKLEKFTVKKKNWTKNYNLSIPMPPKLTSKLHKKPSVLKREHPALKIMRFLNFSLFCGSFLSMTRLNPDPKHWLRDPGCLSQIRTFPSLIKKATDPGNIVPDLEYFTSRIL
jgi:hypothetical protein